MRTKSPFRASLLTAALGLSACVTPGPAPQERAALPPIRRVPAAEWPVVQDDLDAASLARAAENDLAYLRGLGDKTFSVGDSTINTQQLIESAGALLRARRETATPEELTARLKAEFDLFRVVGSTPGGGAFFTAYYQPVVAASPVRTARFAYPLYRRPPDMVSVDLEAFDAKFRGETLSARVDAGGRVVPYFDRRAIDVAKALEGKKLEVVWLENQFDRLDLHIQGGGLLQFPDGRLMIAKYAATNGLPYKSAGMALVGSGAMKREDVNKETLKKYLTEHPEGEAWILSQNPRYAFFDVSEAPADGEPFGTIQRPVTAGRSLAVDPKFTALGAAAFVVLPMPQADAEGKLLGRSRTARLAFLQDTGGAILGPGRVDLYLGHGAQAKTEAASVWNAGELYLLIKKFPPRQR
jgi:membrane-bound lytic murein transglycosylase A